MGQRCIVTVTGVALNESNGLLVLSSGSCGAEDMEVNTGSWTAVRATNATKTEAVFDFGTPMMGSGRSDYSLCWGHNPANLQGHNVRISVGSTLVGASAGAFACTLGQRCNMVLTGF
jgi:hypothetical protein